MNHQSAYKVFCTTCAVLLALTLALAFACVALAGDIASETPLEKAERLTSLLPQDPDTVTEANRTAIEEARAAYDVLNAEDANTFDTTMATGSLCTYGRWLELAVWGLAAATDAIDNSTSLADGDYSAYVTSSSNMGKSSSDRAKSWTVSKLVAKDGKLTATIRCSSTSVFKNLRIGGVDYAAASIDGVPEFSIPFTVNKKLYFTVDASSIADSIAYEFTSTIDLSAASAAEIATAKAAAAQATQRNTSKWTASSLSAVKAASSALASLAKKDGVTSIELQVYTKTLKSALAAVTLKKSSKQSSKTRSSSIKKASSGTSSSKSSATTQTTNTGTAVSTASSSKKESSSASTKKKELKTSGASSTANAAQEITVNNSEIGSSSNNGSEFPYLPVTLGVLFVLLLLLGTALRAAIFMRQMGAKRGSL